VLSNILKSHNIAIQTWLEKF